MLRSSGIRKVLRTGGLMAVCAVAMRARDATLSLLATAHELREQATKPAWMRAYGDRRDT